jgi:hypothetical protein
MSGAGGGSGIGSGGLPPELPFADTAGVPQGWSDAVRVAVGLQVDTVATVAVALDLNAPAAFGAALLRPGFVSEAMAAEGLDQHPVGLTDPTPSIDRMPPVNATVEAQDAGPADLRSPVVPSAAPPQQLAAVLQAAGYGGGASARGGDATAAPSAAGSVGVNVSVVPTAAAHAIAGEPEPTPAATTSANTLGAATSADIPGATSAANTPAATTSANTAAGPGLLGTAIAQVANSVVTIGGVPGNATQGVVAVAYSASAPAVAAALASEAAIATSGGVLANQVQGASLSAQAASVAAVLIAPAAVGAVAAAGATLGNAAQDFFATAGGTPGNAAPEVFATAGGTPGIAAKDVLSTAYAVSAPPVPEQTTAATGFDWQAVADLAVPLLAPATVARQALPTANLGIVAPRPAEVADAAPITAPVVPIARDSGATAQAFSQGSSVPLTDRGAVAPAVPIMPGQAPSAAPAMPVPRVEGSNGSGLPSAIPPLARGDGAGAGLQPDSGRWSLERPAVSGSSIPAAHAAASREPFLVLAPLGQTVGQGAAPLSRHAGDGTHDDRHVVSYAERRQARIDIAPVPAEVPTWRLDDTQTLVTVGPAGPRAAALRAADLYRHLMDPNLSAPNRIDPSVIDRHGSLAAIEPGEGFITWEGSPLWLRLAAIHKPLDLGVLAGASAPGRVQVMRTEHGEWVVEHTGGLWCAPRAVRHHARADDDEALLLDVLYGVSGAAADTAMLRRFEAAHAALRFAGRVAEPAAWRAQEAWAMVARHCAIPAVQPDRDVAPPLDIAQAGMTQAGAMQADMTQADAAQADITQAGMTHDGAMQAALTVVVGGLGSDVAGDPLAVAPLARDRFMSIAATGDPERLVAGLRGLGRATLDRVRQGRIDSVDPLDAVALAVCLGRLARQTAPTVGYPAARAGYRGPNGGRARAPARPPLLPPLMQGLLGVRWRQR